MKKVYGVRVWGFVYYYYPKEELTSGSRTYDKEFSEQLQDDEV